MDARGKGISQVLDRQRSSCWPRWPRNRSKFEAAKTGKTGTVSGILQFLALPSQLVTDPRSSHSAMPSFLQFPKRRDGRTPPVMNCCSCPQRQEDQKHCSLVMFWHGICIIGIPYCQNVDKCSLKSQVLAKPNIPSIISPWYPLYHH